MRIALYLAAILMLAVAVAHSWLGERYILMRLFRRGDLPRLFGGTEFTARTLRFAWHITSVAWVGFAAIFVLMAHPPIGIGGVGFILAMTLLLTATVILFASRGRHLAWPVFLVAGVIALYSTQV